MATKKFLHIALGVAALSIAIFFGTGTYLLATHLPQYESIWTGAFHDWSRIATSMEVHADTIASMDESMEKMLDEMSNISAGVHSVDRTVSHMNGAVDHLARTIPPTMGVMTHSVGRMEDGMSPMGMMRRLSPFP
jgi:hypothetical protein